MVAALLSLAGAGATIEWAAFLVVSVVLLAALRPIARDHQRSKGKIRMNTAALVGQTAMVVERIANAEGVGCVKLDGEIWTARALRRRRSHRARDEGPRARDPGRHGARQPVRETA